MIIGLTGRNGSGKGVVAEFLIQRGFIYGSLSDIIRDELKDRGIEITRENLIRQGNELRLQHGPGVLAEKISERFDSDKNYVIDSIRNPEEVKTLKKCLGFTLAYVDAPIKLRFERVKERRREHDPISYEEFVRLENKECSSDNPAAQQLDKTQKMADIILTNHGPLDELHKQIIDILKENGANSTRPDWDEYFMSIAKVVALRSNCIKRKVAAVIVCDRRIISTGYNGTPRGITNCNEGGCPRCNSFTQQGAKLDECLCSHAEENAITQASYHGVRIKGATIYTTFSPCLMCTKMIINSGIKEVVFSHDYSMGEVPMRLLGEAGIISRKL
ncbi:MAG: deaminase [Chlamydiota bacterium]|nr:deaminase [Chlamydiota bacterium]